MQDTNGRSRGSDKSDLNSKRANSGKRTRSRSPIDRSKRGDSIASRRVYVANVPFDAKWSDIKDLFREKIGNVVYAQLFEDEQSRSRGCGLVEFSDSASAQKAIEILHRYNFRNRELVVKEDLDCERDRFGRLLLPGRKDEGDNRSIDHHDMGRDMGRDMSRDMIRDMSREMGRDMSRDMGGYLHDSGFNPVLPPQTGTWNTYGLSSQFLESLGVQGPLNHRIFVANLDYKVGEKKLEEIFRLAGKVLRVRLYTDSTGQSKGHGTIEFEHPVEAVQGISMFHNQKLYGRQMSIRMDKYETEDVPEELPSKLPAGLEGVGKGLGIGGQPLNVSKSLLCANAPPVVLPTQPTPVPAPVSQPTIPSGMGMGNNIGQLPPVGQNMQQVHQQSPLDSYSRGLNIAGIDSRTLSNLVSSSALSGNLSNSVYSSLQAPANNNIMSSMGNSNPMGNMPSGLSGQNSAPPPSGLSVYSTYENDYRRDDKPYQPMRSLSDTVVVRNLPLTYNWQNLRDRFNEIGEVRYAEFKGPGTALVRFSLERSAQRAVDMMNGIRIENRPIEVNFYY
ncbi:Myelin expression factor 2 [Halotydeus destructor]|nr:Myelin expression factor 2 [Halotydeus destructor]